MDSRKENFCSNCKRYKESVSTYMLEIFIPKQEAGDRVINLCNECVTKYSKKHRKS